jgi:hypothetical protein
MRVLVARTKTAADRVCVGVIEMSNHSRPAAQGSGSHKGMTPPIETIPAGARIQFSLARWAEFPSGGGEERCYLQLSAVYL